MPIRELQSGKLATTKRAIAKIEITDGLARLSNNPYLFIYDGGRSAANYAEKVSRFTAGLSLSGRFCGQALPKAYILYSLEEYAWIA